MLEIMHRQITQDARQAVLVGNAIADFGTDPYGVPYTSTTRKITANEAGSININGETGGDQRRGYDRRGVPENKGCSDNVGINVFATANDLYDSSNQSDRTASPDRKRGACGIYPANSWTQETYWYL